ncbi:MAG: hypothetical protein M1831_003788 [Alyxoria varia]|nr:MAG: hypothetical protein M1831_003788 [Alyxoria varia]
MENSSPTHLPLFTIDSLLALTLHPLLHPLPALLTPLCHLAVYQSIHHPTFPYTLLYVFVNVSINVFWYFDAQLAGGKPRALDWSEEVVLITGGAGGLGKVLARIFGMRGVGTAVVDVVGTEEAVRGEEGWEIAGEVSGREGERMESDAEKEEDVGAEDMGGCVRYYRVDVGDREQVEKLKTRVEKELGTPTILINCAGSANFRPLLSQSAQDISKSFTANYFSHVNAIQTFLPGMLRREQGGTIVTVGSVLGYLGCSGLADYTSAKSALTALHHSLRAELRLMSSSPAKPSTSSTTSQSSPPIPPATYPDQIRLLLLTPGQLLTPLFSRITPPRPFLGPLVPPELLAKEIVKRVDAGVSGEWSVPFYARWAGGVWGILPEGVREGFRVGMGWDEAGWAAATGGEDGSRVEGKKRE